jgi:endoglucanase
VQIRVFDPTAIANPRLVRLAIEVAKEERIPHQVTVRRTGGTDAGSFHISGTGVPSVVLGVPARYIHSHNSIIDLGDYLSMVALTNALVKRLDETTVKELTRFL